MSAAFRTVVVVLAFLLCQISAVAQQAGTALPVLPYHSTDMTLGTVNCANSLCHGSVTSWKDSAVLQNEYVTWSRLDRHALAYSVLANAQSMRIAKNLNMAAPPSQSPLCLDCHTNDVAKDRRGTRFDLTEGVGCEACHGPAQRWMTTHVEPSASHAKNIANGLYPVDQTMARARLCLSCHFGNADKLVTHRLMGAGHPRLSFEIETFAMLEPPHYRLTPSDAGTLHDRAPWDGVRFWAVGQALAVAQTMQLINDPKRGHDGIFPELVLFDCYGCHHPMSDARWKPRQGLGGSLGPGVARLNDSNLLMLRVIARHLDPQLGVEVTDAAQRLHAAAAGDGDLRAQASAMEALANRIAERVQQTTFAAADLHALALGVIDDGLAGNYTDYASAEQAIMSIQSIVDFENRRGLVRSPANVNARLSALRDTLKSDEQFRPADFKSRLVQLRAQL